MPASPALREIAPVSGNDDVQDSETAHRFGMVSRQRKRHRPAPVMADQKKSFDLQMLTDQLPNVVRDGLFVVAPRGTRRIAEAAQIGCNDRVALGEARNDVPPFIGSLRDAVQ